MNYFAFDLKKIERLELYTHVMVCCPIRWNEVLLVMDCL
jgi:hypothetical protein